MALLEVGDEVAERAEVGEEREALREGRPRELPPVSDLRKMDEPVFWELIGRSKSQAESVSTMPS